MGKSSYTASELSCVSSGVRCIAQMIYIYLYIPFSCMDVRRLCSHWNAPWHLKWSKCLFCKYAFFFLFLSATSSFAEAVQVSPHGALMSHVLADNVLRITAACSINLHYINGVNTLADCVRRVYMEGRTSLHHFLHYFAQSSFRLLCRGVKWQPSSGYNMHPAGCHSFHLINRCHVANNSVGTSSDSRNASHTQVSVSGEWCCWKQRKLIPFLSLFCSLAQVDSWLDQPRPLAIQLSLKDSSCAVLGRTEGPLCAPAYRGTTVTAPETL